MTLAHFQLLIPRAQLLHVLTTGTYLAQRWEQASGVNLYHLADQGRGFFVEVGYDQATLATVVRCSFSSVVALEKYTEEVRLPAL